MGKEKIGSLVYESNGCSVRAEGGGFVVYVSDDRGGLRAVAIPAGVPAEAFLAIGAHLKPVPKRAPAKKKKPAEKSDDA
jgi:hypothetical protein